MIQEQQWEDGLTRKFLPEDFKGLKMRMPGLGAEVINRMGAVSVNLIRR